MSGEFDKEPDPNPLLILILCEEVDDEEETEDEDDWGKSSGGVEPDPGELFPFPLHIWPFFPFTIILFWSRLE